MFSLELHQRRPSKGYSWQSKELTWPGPKGWPVNEPLISDIISSRLPPFGSHLRDEPTDLLKSPPRSVLRLCCVSIWSRPAVSPSGLGLMWLTPPPSSQPGQPGSIHHSQPTRPNLWLCVKQEAIYSRLIYSSSSCGYSCRGLMAQYIWGKESRRGERDHPFPSPALCVQWKSAVLQPAAPLHDNPVVRPRVTGN